jgi:hypothetical protein
MERVFNQRKAKCASILNLVKVAKEVLHWGNCGWRLSYTIYWWHLTLMAFFTMSSFHLKLGRRLSGKEFLHPVFQVREESEVNVRREAEAVEQVKRSVQAAEQARCSFYELFTPVIYSCNKIRLFFKIFKPPNHRSRCFVTIKFMIVIFYWNCSQDGEAWARVWNRTTQNAGTYLKWLHIKLEIRKIVLSCNARSSPFIVKLHYQNRKRSW